MYLLLVGILCVLPINAVKWESIDNALKESKTSGKPVLFLMTKSTCKPCVKLNDAMETSKEFEELSKSFSLARAADAEIPDDAKYRFDASYVPKILFISHHGDVHKDVVNADAKSDKAQFFYSKVEHVLKSMNTCLEHANLDHGFGKEYRWHTWESGQIAALEQNKPILLLFHQDWCGACARLKPKFESSPEIKEIADKFIFVNTDNEELVKGEKYKSDGEYYPKILFLDPHADILDGEWNHGTKHHHVKHYYGDGKEIRLSMDRVLGNSTEMETVDDKGFGKHIKWVKFQKGLTLSAAKKKPMMLIIHKSYCGACKALKPRIRNNKEIGELSKKFIMVHCEDDEEPQDDQFDIDGAYIPRIFFLDNNGRVEPTIKSNEQDFKDVRYAYGSATALIESMKKALEMDLGNRVATQQQEQAKTETPKTETAQETPKQEEEPEDPGFPKLRFGPQIKWFSYEDGLVEAKKSHKVSMLVFYNDYCQFSSFMVKQLHDSAEVKELAKKFVMIKISEEELADIKNKERFDLDGTYTPRVIFMDPDQNIHSEINNTDTAYPNTMFYYGDAIKMHEAMTLAVKKINLTLGNGFGEYIEWVRFEKSFELANETGKPIMLIIHKTWCGACAALKPIIHYSRPIWEMSMHFTMVNVEDSDEPIDNQYFVDGGYYPRIYFIHPNTGKVDKTLHNRDPAYLKHKFSYGKEEHIMITMRFAAHKYRNKNAQAAQTTEKTTTTTQTQQSTTQKTTTTTTRTTQQSGNNPATGKELLAASGANFMNIYDATEKAKQDRKPIMFLIHRTTCPSCKALLKSISRDSEFKTKTNGFLLADIEDDIDEKKADSYDVDGGYVPRVYFLDPEGEIIESIWNIGTNYITSKFYYYDMTSLYRGMDKARKHMESWVPGKNKKKTDNIKIEL